MSKGFKLSLLAIVGVILFFIVVGSLYKYKPKQNTTHVAAQNTQQLNDIKSSIGYKLIVLEDGNTDISVNDPRIGALDSKLKLISEQTGLSEKAIADASLFLNKTLKEKNITSDIWNIIEVIQSGINVKAIPLKGNLTQKTLVQWLSMYASSREMGMSHADALKGVKGLNSALHDPEELQKIADNVDLKEVAFDMIKSIDQAFSTISKVTQPSDIEIQQFNEIKKLFEKDLPLDISMLEATNKEGALANCVATGKSANNAWFSLKSGDMKGLEKDLLEYGYFKKACLKQISK